MVTYALFTLATLDYELIMRSCYSAPELGVLIICCSNVAGGDVHKLLNVRVLGMSRLSGCYFLYIGTLSSLSVMGMSGLLVQH